VAMSIHLWLIRHGSTDWSDKGRLNGWTDVSLNEAGRREARGLGFLRSMSFAGLWSSDLARAQETAVIAVGGAVADPRLRELDFGVIEGCTWNQCSPAIQGAMKRFDDFVAPQGESTQQLTERVLAFMDDLTEGDHLLFTHGGVIRTLLRRVRADDQVEPGGIVRIDRGREGAITSGHRPTPDEHARPIASSLSSKQRRA
jgi:2,3-bisphosphoglycerate-dependent phosphoglycerate mutase